jgi:hypothetical protein
MSRQHDSHVQLWRVHQLPTESKPNLILAKMLLSVAVTGAFAADGKRLSVPIPRVYIASSFRLRSKTKVV